MEHQRALFSSMSVLHAGADELKVAFLFPSLKLGGVEQVLAALANGLHQRGVDVSAYHAIPGGEFEGRLVEGITQHSVGATRFLMTIPKLVHRLRCDRPDVLVSAKSYANVGAVWAAQLCGSRKPKVVVTCHSMISMAENFAGIAGKLRVGCYKPVFQKADAIVCVSQAVLDDMRVHWSSSLPNGHVIYNPVLPVKAPEGENQEIPSQQRPFILACGRLAHEKRYDLLIRAMQSVDDAYDLLIIGDGPERDALGRLASELGVAQRVKFLGYHPYPGEWMSRCRLMVMCSKYEALPTVLIEALSVGARVISTDIPGGTAEIYRVLGQEYQPVAANPAELAAAINGALYAKMRDIPPTCPDQFRIESVCAKYLSLFEQISRQAHR